MENIYIFLMILGYFLFIFSCYIFTVKRLKHLTQKHVEYTKIKWLNDLNNSLLKIVFLLFITLFVLCTFIILTFL